MKKKKILTFLGVFLLLFFINYLSYQYLKSVLISRTIDLLHIFFFVGDSSVTADLFIPFDDCESSTCFTYVYVLVYQQNV